MTNDKSAETRAYDLEFDTHVEVALNPHGAWLTIQYLESQRDEALARAEAAEAVIAMAEAMVEEAIQAQKDQRTMSKGKTDDQ